MTLFKQAKSGFWYIDYYDDCGKRIRISTKTKNKTLAQKVEAKFIEESRLKKFGMDTPKSILFEELLDKYMEFASSSVKESTYSRYLVSAHQFTDTFAGKFIDRISSMDIEEYKQKRIKSVSKATVNRDLAVLRRMFNQAKKWNLLNKNPMDSVDLFRENNIRDRFLNKDEIKRLLDECKKQPHLFLAVYIAINTGMRKREILTLKVPAEGENRENMNWIDLDQKWFHLNITKSSKSRSLPISDEVFAIIEKTLRLSPNGKLFQVKDIRESFENAVRRAGLTNVIFHDLRRTFISHAMMIGYSQEKIQRMVGQDDPGVFKRYAHLSSDSKRDIVNHISNYFS